MSVEIYFLLATLLEVSKLFFVSRFLFGFRFRKLPLLICFTAFAVLVFLPLDLSETPIGTGIEAPIILSFAVIGRGKKRAKSIGYLFLFFILLAVLDSVLTDTTLFLFPAVSSFYQTYLGLLTRNSVSLVLLLLIYAVLRKMNLVPFTLRGKSMAVFFIAAGIFLGLMLAGFRLLSLDVISVSDARRGFLVVFPACAVFLTALSVLLIRTGAKNRKLIEDTLLSNARAEAEIAYYQSLLAKEEKTRAFRHDMRSHLLSLTMLCQNERYDEVAAYLAELSEILGRAE